MSENEKLDKWGTWRRDAIQDYGNASLRYAREGRKFMSFMAAVGEAAADLSPHTNKGVALEIASMATGFGPVSKGLKAAGILKDLITTVKAGEHIVEGAHLANTIGHSVKNIVKAVVPPEKMGSINSVKGAGVYTKLPTGFFKAATKGTGALQPKSTTGSRLKTPGAHQHKGGVKHGVTILADRMTIRTLGSAPKPLGPKINTTKMNLMPHKTTQNKFTIKTPAKSHLSLMPNRSAAMKPAANRALSKPIQHKVAAPMNTMRKAAVSRPMIRPMGRR